MIEQELERLGLEAKSIELLILCRLRGYSNYNSLDERGKRLILEDLQSCDPVQRGNISWLQSTQTNTQASNQKPRRPRESRVTNQTDPIRSAGS